MDCSNRVEKVLTDDVSEKIKEFGSLNRRIYRNDLAPLIHRVGETQVKRVEELERMLTQILLGLEKNLGFRVTEHDLGITSSEDGETEPVSSSSSSADASAAGAGAGGSEISNRQVTSFDRSANGDSGSHITVTYKERLPRCLVCLNTRASVLLFPCRHLATCATCWDEIEGRGECPYCRDPVESHYGVFM